MPPKKRKSSIAVGKDAPIAAQPPSTSVTRAAKRVKTPVTTNGQVNTKTQRRRSSKTEAKENDAVDDARNAFFHQYKDKEGDRICPEGIERFCNDVGISIESFTFLYLAYKMKAENIGYFSKDEFLRGVQALQIDSVSTLKYILPDIEAIPKQLDKLKDIYTFAFNFTKTEGQKCLEIGTATAMWELILGGTSNHVKNMIDFIQTRKPVNVITRDQYMNFYDFATTINEDLTNYDESSAWPVLFDEYVEWKRNNNTRI